MQSQSNLERKEDSTTSRQSREFILTHLNLRVNTSSHGRRLWPNSDRGICFIEMIRGGCSGETLEVKIDFPFLKKTSFNLDIYSSQIMNIKNDLGHELELLGGQQAPPFPSFNRCDLRLNQMLRNELVLEDLALQLSEWNTQSVEQCLIFCDCGNAFASLECDE